MIPAMKRKDRQNVRLGRRKKKANGNKQKWIAAIQMRLHPQKHRYRQLKKSRNNQHNLERQVHHQVANCRHYLQLLHQLLQKTTIQLVRYLNLECHRINRTLTKPNINRQKILIGLRDGEISTRAQVKALQIQSVHPCKQTKIKLKV